MRAPCVWWCVIAAQRLMGVWGCRQSRAVTFASWSSRNYKRQQYAAQVPHVLPLFNVWPLFVWVLVLFLLVFFELWLMHKLNSTLHHHSGVKHLCMAVKRTFGFILSPCQDRDYKNRHTGNRLSLSEEPPRRAPRPLDRFPTLKCRLEYSDIWIPCHSLWNPFTEFPKQAVVKQIHKSTHQ